MNERTQAIEQNIESIIKVIKKSSISVDDFETYLIPLLNSVEQLKQAYKIEIEMLKKEN